MSLESLDQARHDAYARRAELYASATARPVHLRYRCPRGIYGHVTVLVADTDPDIGGRVLESTVLCLDCPPEEQALWWALGEKGERW